MSYPTEPSASAKTGGASEMKREVLDLAKLVMLFLILFWGLKSFVIEGYEVQGPSMIPTLEDKERILVLKLPHELSRLPFFSGINAVREGDVVVFDSTVEANKRYIKRVIAKGEPRKGGNTVSAREKDGFGAQTGTAVRFSHGDVYVNNRHVEENYIIPEERRQPDEHSTIYLGPGEYYVLGDHRSVSKDSRSFQAVDDNQVIGRAVLRFWPLNKFGIL